jgi:hypothetical protein
MIDHEKNPPGEDELVDFVSSITGQALLRIEEKLPHGYVRLKVAEAERRQAQHDIRSVEDIVIELVRNSRDAGARIVLVGFQKEQGRYRRITVVDDGCGIPEEMHGIIFEPRVTSKGDEFHLDRYGVHGRGMALFSIKSRSDDARVFSSVPGQGTAIVLSVDTVSVPERSDQATVPSLDEVDGEEEVGGGPHNVPRALLEMSVDYPKMRFYLGSFTEVIATLRTLAGDREEHEDALWQGLSDVNDARRLMEMAQSLGFPISERNAYRVLGGEIAPLGTVYDMATENRQDVTVAEKPETLSTRHRGSRKRNPLRRISPDDMAEIGSEAGRAAERVLGRYYLKSSGTPHVRRGRGKLIISIYVDGEDGEDQ